MEQQSANKERLRQEARGTPAGVKRDQMLRRALQIESHVRANELLNAPSVKPLM